MIQGLYPIFDHWHRQGTVWIFSDPHFNDPDLAYIKGRPTAEEQVKMINSKVGKKDTLIILGDIGDIECAKQLKGYKILVCGNHDAGATIYQGVFNEVYTGPLMIGEKLILSHEPLPIDWAFNLHGHVHDRRHKNDKYHFNCCSEAIGYMPINFNQWMKEGHLKPVQSMHRNTIDKATFHKQKRGGKKIHET